jgi:hypothetical protein
VEFYAEHPAPVTAWRLAVLMGANTRTYKFALASALLGFAREGRTELTLPELASPYAMSLVEHADKMPQARTISDLGEADFLSVARTEAAETLRTGAPTERLIDAAAKSMPQMVMQKFHNLSGSEVPHRFYEIVGTGPGRRVRLTPELSRIAASESTAQLDEELMARWAIVETSFSSGVGASLISEGFAVDIEGVVLTDRLRRRSITGLTAAVVGFQHGRCIICEELITPADNVAVDHVFPFSLMQRGFPLGWQGLDLDAVWNLAPTHALCNGIKSNALPSSGGVARLARRNAAIMNSPHPLRRTLELTLQSRGFAGRAEDWPRFLAGIAER